MAELERELAELLDTAPLLPEDDDEGSGVDFVPPPNVAPRRENEPRGPSDVPPEPTSSPAPTPSPESVAAAAEAPVAPATAREPVALPRPVAARQPAGAERKSVTRMARSKAALPAAGRGTLALVTTLIVAALLIVGMILTWPTPLREARGPARGVPAAALKSDSRAPTPEPHLAAPQSAPSPAASVSAGDAPPTGGAATESSLAPEFSVVDMLTALAPAAIEAGRCRHTGEPKGRVHVRVTIGEGGTIESVFAGHAYKDSETAACIERKFRSAKLPPFSGKGGSVVLPIDLR